MINMTHRFQACIAVMLLLRYPLKHRRKIICLQKNKTDLFTKYLLFFVKICLNGTKLLLASVSLFLCPYAKPFCSCQAKLTIWQNDWTADNLTNNKWLTVTIDGSKCTNDITSLHFPITSRLKWQMTNNIATSLTNQVNNQSLVASTDVIQLTLTLKMTTAQVVEISVTVDNSPTPIQMIILNLLSLYFIAIACKQALLFVLC